MKTLEKKEIKNVKGGIGVTAIRLRVAVLRAGWRVGIAL